VVTPLVCLSIAGSDSGGGAGIQADLKAFSALGAFGTTAITAVTAQNTVGVDLVHVVPPEVVDAQIAAVLADLGPRGTKTGMLATAANVAAVARWAATGDLENLVVDPVMVASTGARLLDEEAQRTYLDLLIPHAVVVTPNLYEASLLMGRTLSSPADMAEAAAFLRRVGAKVAVVKGGHLEGPWAVDVVDDGSEVRELKAPKVKTPNVHGTGCTLSAATAAYLARGEAPMAAVEQAKRFVSRAVEGGARWQLGQGHGPLDPLGWEPVGGAP
jgi:hydroxymethylpyrimidine/phosphomethylpyrimidine kinase